jgi:exosome complex exonuclease RRP6
MPKPLGANVPDPSEQEVMMDDASMAVLEQPEVPFVPLSQRQTVAREVIDDSVVIVGQRQQKKRKRNKEKKEKSHVAEQEQEEPEQDVQPFDYASVPNILDDDSETRGDPVERPKKKPKAKGRILTSSGVCDGH